MFKLGNFSKHTAKLNKDLLRDFGIGNLILSKTAINLLNLLTRYVDYDGRIHIDKESMRKHLYCDRRTLDRVLFELQTTTYKGMKLLTFENGYYVSYFHVSSKGKTTYLKYLPVFTSYKIFNLTLNQTRLFYYIATLNIHNQFTKVAIENLYNNKLHDKRFGMHVYDDYKSVAEDLFKLIELDLISVRLPGEESALVLNKTVEGYQHLFHETCGFINNKKRRTSKYYKKKHIIGLKVNQELYDVPALKNQANKMEICLLAERYHMFHEDMKEDTFNFFISKKNKLVEQFGKAGLDIYRSSLEKYFNEKNEDILYYDILGKAENYFNNFYLLEEIKKVILGAIRSELGNIGSIAATGYSFTKAHIPSLVEYFIVHSGEEHKILLDQDICLIQKASELMSSHTQEPWASLHESIEHVYSVHISEIEKSLREECQTNGIAPSKLMLSKINSRKLVVELANQSILSQKMTIEEKTEKIKQVVRFFKKKQLPIKLDMSKKPQEVPQQREVVPFYNWLES